METSRDDLSIVLRSTFLKKSAQQKFSLFALVVVSFLLLFVETFENKPLDYARKFLRDGIYRAASFASFPEKLFSYVSEKISDHFYVLEENENLKKEFRTYKQLVHNRYFQNVEQSKIEQLLDKIQQVDYDTVTAKVILDKDSPFIKSIIVNKGQKDGIKIGMPVIDYSNFIGRVVETNFFSYRVLLLTDLNSKIPVILGSAGYQGILSGLGTEEPIVEFLPKNYEIKNKDPIYTSGKDGILLSGLPIGEIKLSDDRVLVSLFSDLNQLSFVSILLDEPRFFEIGEND